MATTAAGSPPGEGGGRKGTRQAHPTSRVRGSLAHHIPREWEGGFPQCLAPTRRQRGSQDTTQAQVPTQHPEQGPAVRICPNLTLQPLEAKRGMKNEMPHSLCTGKLWGRYPTHPHPIPAYPTTSPVLLQPAFPFYQKASHTPTPSWASTHTPQTHTQ